MANVARPIKSSEPTSVALRPMRSPKWPNTTEPKGRAIKATPNVAIDAKRAVLPPAEAKNKSGKTETAAVA